MKTKAMADKEIKRQAKINKATVEFSKAKMKFLQQELIYNMALLKFQQAQMAHLNSAE